MPSDPVQIEQGGGGNQNSTLVAEALPPQAITSSPKCGRGPKGVLTEIVRGAKDLIPRAAGPGAPQYMPARNLAQGSRPSWSRNPGVGERHCGHDLEPPVSESTPTSPNSPFTIIEGQNREAKRELIELKHEAVQI